MKVVADRDSKRVKRVMIEVPKSVVPLSASSPSNDLGGLCGGIDRPSYVGYEDDNQNSLYSTEITDELMSEYWK